MLPVIGNYDAVGKETWLKRYTEMSNYGEYSSVLFLGGDNVEIGGLSLFSLLYSSIIFTVCLGKVMFPCYFLDLQSFGLAMQDSDPSFYYTKT